MNFATQVHFYGIIPKPAARPFLICNRPYWPAPGSEDTELGVLMEPGAGQFALSKTTLSSILNAKARCFAKKSLCRNEIIHQSIKRPLPNSPAMEIPLIKTMTNGEYMRLCQEHGVAPIYVDQRQNGRS